MKNKNDKNMIIEVLKQKYKCGCNRGINKFSQPGLLMKLNTVIEWQYSRGKENLNKKDEDDPELQPGDVFLYKGQVVGVNDKDSLVLVVSETGAFALQRLWDEHISVEIGLMFNSNPLDLTLRYEVVDSYPPGLEEYSPEYKLYNIFRERFINGRGFNSDFCIKVEINSDNYLISPIVYLRRWTILYDPEEFEPDQLPELSKTIVSWFYENTARIKETVDEYWAKLDKEMGSTEDDTSGKLSI